MQISAVSRWRPGGWLAEPAPQVVVTPTAKPPITIHPHPDLPQWHAYDEAEQALLDQPTPTTLGRYANAVRAILQQAMARMTTRQHKGRSSVGSVHQWVWVQEAEGQLKMLAETLRSLDAAGLLRATGQLRGLLLNLLC